MVGTVASACSVAVPVPVPVIQYSFQRPSSKNDLPGRQTGFTESNLIAT